MTTEQVVCVARQHPDQQIRCLVCRLSWDVDDPNPPECGKLRRIEAPPLVPRSRPAFASGLPFVDSPNKM